VLGHSVGMAADGELGGDGEEGKSEVSVPAENSSPEDVPDSSIFVEDENVSNPELVTGWNPENR
jgi:hypothetical protein